MSGRDVTTVPVIVEPGDGVDRSQPAYYATGLELPDGMSFEDWERLGGELQKMVKGAQWWLGDWWRHGEWRYGEHAAQAVGAGYDVESVRNAAWVAERIEFVRRRTNLSWSHHQEVAALEPDDQDAYLDQAEQENWTRNQLRARVQERRKHARLAAAALPADVFNVVYADPPWEYEFSETVSRSIEAHYPSMTLEEICALPVGGHVADDAILFLWATSPKLEEALSVVIAWGFTYRTNLVWVKDKIGMGYWARGRHELLLVCRRGEFPAPRQEERPDSVIEWPREEHSRKPDLVYELIERLYPVASRLELFARRPREGWTQWGNDVGSA